MAFNGSGTFNLASGNPVVTNTTISSTVQNNTLSDIATGLSNCVTRDGQSPATANLPMGSHKITGLLDGTSASDAASLSQVQSSVVALISSISGADTITGTLSPALTAYAAGQTFRFISAGANTGAVTLNINSLGAKSITKLGTTALAANDIPSGAVVEVVYDGTQFQLVGLASSHATLADNATNATTAPQFDNDTSIATTAFVQRAIGNFSGFMGYATSQVLTAGNMGNWIAPTVGSLTFTLPAASSVSIGSTITIFGNGLGVTIQRSGTDTINNNGSGVTSLVLDIFDTIQLVAGGTIWYTTYKSSIDTGTGAYVRANSPTLTGNPTAPTPAAGDNDTSIATTAFVSSLVGGTTTAASSLAANGYQKLPSGLLIQWGAGASGAPVSVTFPIAFPTACRAVVAVSTGSNAAVPQVSTFTTTTFSWAPGNAAAPSSWIAIGY